MDDESDESILGYDSATNDCSDDLRGYDKIVHFACEKDFHVLWTHTFRPKRFSTCFEPFNPYRNHWYSTPYILWLEK